MRALFCFVSALAVAICLLPLPGFAAEPIAASSSERLSVRSLEGGGMVTVQHEYRGMLGDSQLIADKAVSFSPDGAAWSREILENVVVQGTGVDQPLFMPRAVRRTSPAGEPMLVGRSVLAARQGVVITWTCTSGELYANGVNTHKSSICLGRNMVVQCGKRGDHVWVIRTTDICAAN